MRYSVLTALIMALVFCSVASADIVGSERDFWIWDLSVMPPVDAQITATCVAASGEALIYIENQAWANQEMTQTDANTVLDVFSNQTPAGSYDPNMGIYEIETTIYGDTTDVDSDGYVILLFYNLEPFQGVEFDGYFRYEDLQPGATSNMSEVLHLNIHDHSPTSEYMLGVVAHEFNHMIHTPMDPFEEMWLSEAVAESAMIACGYGDDAWFESFLNNSKESFWGDEHSVHYGAALVLGTYLYEQLGADIKDVVEDTAKGFDSVQGIFDDVFGTGDNFFEQMTFDVYMDYKGMTPAPFEHLDFSELNPAFSVDQYPYESSKVLKAGSFHIAQLAAYDQAPASFVYRIKSDNPDVIALYVAQITETTKALGFDFVLGTLNEYACVDTVDDESNPLTSQGLVLINDSEDGTTYEVSLYEIDDCGNFNPDDYPDDDDDDDTSDDDDDVSDDDDDDDDAAQSDDDDDDDDGGCGC